jgi:hypothetical protein
MSRSRRAAGARVRLIAAPHDRWFIATCPPGASQLRLVEKTGAGHSRPIPQQFRS